MLRYIHVVKTIFRADHIDKKALDASINESALNINVFSDTVMM